MTDRELIKKLNSLRNIGPDQNWLKSNRELLLSQISNSGARDLPAWRVMIIDLASALRSAAQPVYALGAFVLLLLGSAVYSQSYLAQTKPTDSLYIARVISEKLKLNTTFNSEDRDKLAAQLAASRAKDISAVLADPTFNTEANKDEVAKLNDNFRQEVNTVKDSISRLPKKSTAAATPATSTSGDEVVIADNSKDTERVQISETPSLSAMVAPTGTPSTSTDATGTEATTTPAAVTNEADKILDEATQLFNQKDYTKASDKLKEVDEIIKQ